METLFGLYDFQPDDVLVDLGSGDGRMLLAAAHRSVKSVGYELNPLLAAISWLRLRSVRHLAQVRCRDFWLTPLPNDTAVVFVFLASPFMKKLDKHMAREVKRLGKDLTLISYGVKVDGRPVDKELGGFVAYHYKA